MEKLRSAFYHVFGFLIGFFIGWSQIVHNSEHLTMTVKWLWEKNIRGKGWNGSAYLDLVPSTVPARRRPNLPAVMPSLSRPGSCWVAFGKGALRKAS
jgi:hypothetical protein